MTRRMDLATLEDVPRLDVAALLAGGPVDVGKVIVQAEPRGDTVGLSWVRPDGGRSSQTLKLIRYPLPLGGSKALIVCPCGARVRSVFLDVHDCITWGCRHCMGLRWRSQRVGYPSAGHEVA